MVDLRNSLRELTLKDVEETGVEVGKGAYGEVKEYILPGRLRCAGKNIHKALSTADSEQSTAVAERFEEECKLLNKQLHPNIVLFLGVHFERDEAFPVLLMELLPLSLDTALAEYRDPNMPDYIKYSILCDVAFGLSFLHSKEPPILHRDLTTTNILLTESFRAKISDLGMAKIKTVGAVQKLTTMPGNPAFMPPEAYLDDPNYGSSLDMFSYGVMILSTILQEWPKPDCNIKEDKVVREVVRRSKELCKMGNDHPLRQFTEDCLRDDPQHRPTASDAAEIMSRVIKRTPRPHKNIMQMIRHNMDLGKEMSEMKEKVKTLDTVNEHLETEFSLNSESCIHLKMEKDVLSEQLKATRMTLRSKDDEISQLNVTSAAKENLIQSLQIQNEELHKKASNKAILLAPSASLDWIKCSNLPLSRTHLQAVEHEGRVYIGSGYAHVSNESSKDVFCYSPEEDKWEESIESQTVWFAMTVFDNRVVLIGGKEGDEFSKQVQVLVEGRRGKKFEGQKDIAEMPSARAGCVATSLPFNIVVAGGYGRGRSRMSTVEVYDRRSMVWSQVADLPRACAEMKCCTVEGNWYLMGGSDQYNHVFAASLQKLVTTPEDASPIWSTLPNFPYNFSFVAAFGGSLVAMGGEKQGVFFLEHSSQIFVYSCLKKAWLHVGALPLALTRSAVVVLPNTAEMLVIGGRSKTEKELNSVYKCKLTCPM